MSRFDRSRRIEFAARAPFVMIGLAVVVMLIVLAFWHW
jgi:hypothetical protein